MTKMGVTYPTGVNPITAGLGLGFQILHGPKKVRTGLVGFIETKEAKGGRRTIIGWSSTFGPCLSESQQRSHEFYLLVDNETGVISGIFHDGLDPASRGCISEIGVTCNGQRCSKLQDLEPPFALYNMLPFPVPDDPPTLGWYVTKAPLERLLKVQVCRDQAQRHRPCIGLLLHYKTGQVESLGQIRFDRDLSDEVFAPIRIQSANLDGASYIKDVQRSPGCAEHGVGQMSGS